jgi:ABC-type sugar transport system ATPase subunit
MIPCEAQVEGDRVRVLRGSYSWLLDAEKSAHVRHKMRSHDVVLGIRPDDIRLYAEAGSGRVPVTVYVTEPQGHEVVVDLSFERMILRAKEDREKGLGTRLKENEKVYIEFNLPHCHIFDRVSQMRIG